MAQVDTALLASLRVGTKASGLTLQPPLPEARFPPSHPPPSVSQNRAGQWTPCPSAAEGARGEPGSHTGPLPGATRSPSALVACRL